MYFVLLCVIIIITNPISSANLSFAHWPNTNWSTDLEVNLGGLVSGGVGVLASLVLDLAVDVVHELVLLLAELILQLLRSPVHLVVELLEQGRRYLLQPRSHVLQRALQLFQLLSRLRKIIRYLMSPQLVVVKRVTHLTLCAVFRGASCLLVETNILISQKYGLDWSYNILCFEMENILHTACNNFTKHISTLLICEYLRIKYSCLCCTQSYVKFALDLPCNS